MGVYTQMTASCKFYQSTTQWIDKMPTDIMGYMLMQFATSLAMGIYRFANGDLPWHNTLDGKTIPDVFD
jgi:hypothetical protein